MTRKERWEWLRLVFRDRCRHDENMCLSTAKEIAYTIKAALVLLANRDGLTTSDLRHDTVLVAMGGSWSTWSDYGPGEDWQELHVASGITRWRFEIQGNGYP